MKRKYKVFFQSENIKSTNHLEMKTGNTILKRLLSFVLKKD